jgi:hypothetical protein
MSAACSGQKKTPALWERSQPRRPTKNRRKARAPRLPGSSMRALPAWEDRRMAAAAILPPGKKKTPARFAAERGAIGDAARSTCLRQCPSGCPHLGSALVAPALLALHIVQVANGLSVPPYKHPRGSCWGKDSAARRRRWAAMLPASPRAEKPAPKPDRWRLWLWQPLGQSKDASFIRPRIGSSPLGPPLHGSMCLI